MVGMTPSDAKLPPKTKRIPLLMAGLAQLYPETGTALEHRDPLQLAVATILSAQCTDARVNLVTPALFARYRTAQDFADAKLRDLQSLIRSTGFFRNKAKNIQSMCRQLVEKYDGQVPSTLVELVALPGVGRKTANVILGDAFGVPGITVDTHVGRLSRRLGLTKQTDPVKVEFELMRLVPRDEWTRFSHRLIFHGRRVCFARKPQCSSCSLAPLCPQIGIAAQSTRRHAIPTSRRKTRTTGAEPGRRRTTAHDSTSDLMT